MALCLNLTDDEQERIAKNIRSSINLDFSKASSEKQKKYGAKIVDRVVSDFEAEKKQKVSNDVRAEIRRLAAQGIQEKKAEQLKKKVERELGSEQADAININEIKSAVVDLQDINDEDLSKDIAALAEKEFGIIENVELKEKYIKNQKEVTDKVNKFTNKKLEDIAENLGIPLPDKVQKRRAADKKRRAKQESDKTAEEKKQDAQEAENLSGFTENGLLTPEMMGKVTEAQMALSAQGIFAGSNNLYNVFRQAKLGISSAAINFFEKPATLMLSKINSRVEGSNGLINIKTRVPKNIAKKNREGMKDIWRGVYKSGQSPEEIGEHLLLPEFGDSELFQGRDKNMGIIGNFYHWHAKATDIGTNIETPGLKQIQQSWDNVQQLYQKNIISRANGLTDGLAARLFKYNYKINKIADETPKLLAQDFLDGNLSKDVSQKVQKKLKEQYKGNEVTKEFIDGIINKKTVKRIRAKSPKLTEKLKDEQIKSKYEGTNLWDTQRQKASKIEKNKIYKQIGKEILKNDKKKVLYDKKFETLYDLSTLSQYTDVSFLGGYGELARNIQKDAIRFSKEHNYQQDNKVIEGTYKLRKVFDNFGQTLLTEYFGLDPKKASLLRVGTFENSIIKTATNLTIKGADYSGQGTLVRGAWSLGARLKNTHGEVTDLQNTIKSIEDRVDADMRKEELFKELKETDPNFINEKHKRVRERAFEDTGMDVATAKKINLFTTINRLVNGDDTIDWKKTVKDLKLHNAVTGAVISGIIAHLLTSNGTEYYGSWESLSENEKKRMEASGAFPNSFKVGNTYVTTNVLGPLEGQVSAAMRIKKEGIRNPVASFASINKFFSTFEESGSITQYEGINGLTDVGAWGEAIDEFTAYMEEEDREPILNTLLDLTIKGTDRNVVPEGFNEMLSGITGTDSDLVEWGGFSAEKFFMGNIMNKYDPDITGNNEDLIFNTDFSSASIGDRAASIGDRVASVLFGRRVNVENDLKEEHAMVMDELGDLEVAGLDVTPTKYPLTQQGVDLEGEALFKERKYYGELIMDQFYDVIVRSNTEGYVEYDGKRHQVKQGRRGLEQIQKALKARERKVQNEYREILKQTYPDKVKKDNE